MIGGAGVTSSARAGGAGQLAPCSDPLFQNRDLLRLQASPLRRHAVFLLASLDPCQQLRLLRLAGHHRRQPRIPSLQDSRASVQTQSTPDFFPVTAEAVVLEDRQHLPAELARGRVHLAGCEGLLHLGGEEPVYHVEYGPVRVHLGDGGRPVARCPGLRVGMPVLPETVLTGSRRPPCLVVERAPARLPGGPRPVPTRSPSATPEPSRVPSRRNCFSPASWTATQHSPVSARNFLLPASTSSTTWWGPASCPPRRCSHDRRSPPTAPRARAAWVPAGPRRDHRGQAAGKGSGRPLCRPARAAPPRRAEQQPMSAGRHRHFRFSTQQHGPFPARANPPLVVTHRQARQQEQLRFPCRHGRRQLPGLFRPAIRSLEVLVEPHGDFARPRAGQWQQGVWRHGHVPGMAITAAESLLRQFAAMNGNLIQQAAKTVGRTAALGGSNPDGVGVHHRRSRGGPAHVPTALHRTAVQPAPDALGLAEGIAHGHMVPAAPCLEPGVRGPAVPIAFLLLGRGAEEEETDANLAVYLAHAQRPVLVIFEEALRRGCGPCR